MPALRFSLPRPFLTAMVGAFLAIHAWLAVSATIDLGVTGDETIHLTGGYSYWRFDDYRLHPENGNLPQRWAALPLLKANPRLDPQSRPDLWQWSDVWQIGQQFFFESGNNIDYLLLCARTMMVLWSLATALLVYFWSRQLWGDCGALLSLALFALSPTTLAHGALVTSDFCAAFWLLAATWAWWRLTERIDAGRFTLSLIATSLLAVAKFSCVLLGPIVGLICLYRICRPGTVPAAGNRELRSRTAKLSVFATLVLLHLAFATFVIWAFFGFRYSAFNPGLPPALDFYASAQDILPTTGPIRWTIVHARELRLLPEAYLQGFNYVLYAERARAAFVAGEYSTTGWWWFFPLAFLVKSSIAELCVAASLPILGGLAWLRRRRTLEPLLPLLVLGLVYGTASLASHLNIGQRHILPLYPVLYILAGALLATARPALFEASPKATSMNRSVGVVRLAFAGLVVGCAVVELVSIRPDYLAFFNRLAGGPENGRRLLGDSSLDWGQNLPRLAAWLEANRDRSERIYISSFGADDPFYRGIDGIELSPYYTFGRNLKWADLTPGLYCIGASMLQDAGSPFAGSWTRQREVIYQHERNRITEEISSGRRSPHFRWDTDPNMELWRLDRARFARLCMYLRIRKPDAVIGHTIYVFRLTPREISETVTGSLTDLAGAIERANAARTP